MVARSQSTRAHLWLVWYPLHEERRAVVAPGVLQAGIHWCVNVPLNRGELWQPAGLRVRKRLLQLRHWILLRQEVHGAMVLALLLWQALELW